MDAAVKAVVAAMADAVVCDNNDAAHDDIRGDSMSDDSMHDNACNGAHDNGHEPADDAWAVVEAVAALTG